MCSFHRRFIWLAAPLLGGCASLPPTLPPERPPAAVAEACPNWRWIAVKSEPGRPCPIPRSSTRVEGPPRLGDLAPSREHNPGGPSRSLKRFCAYEFRKDDSEQPLRELIDQGRLRQAERDCAVMASLASDAPTLQGQIWRPLQEHFDDQVGRSAVPDVGKHRPAVRLAVLDTQPKDLWERQEPGTAPHGWALAHMGRHLVCPDRVPAASDRCAAEVSTRLALPWLELDRRRFHERARNRRVGGYFGTVSDLAEAIGRELAEAEEGGEHLVLNLSVGWDGKTFGGLEEHVEDMPPAVQLLYHVLEEAACRGVIVVAAAGNRLGGPEPQTGLLLPAAWVGRAVEEATCERILSAATDEEGAAPVAAPGFPRPLVYAVGGVDGAGRPLSIARLEGMPELAAFADHAVVETLEPGVPTKTYTGSSVAAAVASAGAARVWSAYPERSSQQVMKSLYDSGCELQRSADVVAEPPLGAPSGATRIASLGTAGGVAGPGFRSNCTAPPCVRRVVLGRALSRACEGSGGLGCEVACPGPKSPDVDPPEPKRTFDVSGHTQSEPAGRPCAAEEILVPPVHGHLRLETPCPADEFEGILTRPWAGPQPQDPPCPNCTLEPPGTGSGGGEGFAGGILGDAYTLYIEIDEDWPAGAVLGNPTLRLGSTLLPLSLASGLSTLGTGGGGKVKVENIPATLVNQADRIVLEFTIREGSETRSVENPVLVAK